MNELLSYLPEEDKILTQNYINAFADTGINNTNIDHILRFWGQNKQKLFDMMGKQLIITKNVKVHKSLDDLQCDFDDLLNKKSNTFMNEWFNMRYAYRRAESGLIAEYGGDWHEVEEVGFCLSDMTNMEFLFSNIWGGKTFEFRYPGSRPVRIEHGCKLLKAMGKIANAAHLNGFEDFRIAHSMCLNQKMMEGELCLSIHPLDYMTMSDNDSGWDSCMSWENGGDYRAGTVEMMNSPYVVVGYFKGHDMEVPGGHWNNKRWRCLYIVSDKLIMEVRQYPYESDDLNGLCLKQLHKMASAVRGNGPYVENLCRFDLEENYTFIPEIDHNVELEFYTGLMYNDCYGVRHGYVAKDIGTQYDINYSGPCECMQCGAEITDTSDEEASCLVMSCCNPHFYCECCEEIIYDDDVYELDGDKVCRYCYENHIASCTCCDDSHADYNMQYIALYLNKQDTGYRATLCDSCYNLVIGQDQLLDHESLWSGTLKVEAKYIKPEHLDVFGVNPEYGGEDLDDYNLFVQAYNEEHGIQQET